MTAVGFTESIVEIAALEWFEQLGYEIVHGPDISPDGPYPHRSDYREVIHRDTIRQSLERINPDVSREAIDVAVRVLSAPASFCMYVLGHIGTYRPSRATLLSIPPGHIDCRGGRETVRRGASYGSPSFLQPGFRCPDY